MTRLIRVATDLVHEAARAARDDEGALHLLVEARRFLAAVEVYEAKLEPRSVPLCPNPTHTTACCLEKL